MYSYTYSGADYCQQCLCSNNMSAGRRLHILPLGKSSAMLSDLNYSIELHY